jgi:hypothetical protein
MLTNLGKKKTARIGDYQSLGAKVLFEIRQSREPMAQEEIEARLGSCSGVLAKLKERKLIEEV